MGSPIIRMIPAGDLKAQGRATLRMFCSNGQSDTWRSPRAVFFRVGKKPYRLDESAPDRELRRIRPEGKTPAAHIDFAAGLAAVLEGDFAL
jgi:hypothetical protein